MFSSAHWRNRAIECRAIAENFLNRKDKNALRALLQLADDYDQVAVRQERAEQSDPFMHSRRNDPQWYRWRGVAVDPPPMNGNGKHK